VVEQEHDSRRGSGVMSEPSVLLGVEDHVATLTINRPERRNALGSDTVNLLRQNLATAKADPTVRVVVITGAGDQAFSAGADLSGMQPDASFVDVHEGRGEFTRFFIEMYSLGKPTIAKVRGWCLAGGFGVALSCDIVVASDDAVFGTPEINVGIWPMMITVPLLRSLPPKRALELMMTGRRVRAAEAEQLGFVNRVVAPEELDTAVAEIAQTLAEKPPAAMKLGRDAFYAVLDMDAEHALRLLHQGLSLVNLTEDAREGVTAFQEKRKPEWTGR
jgi:enoyl-CoA hydratase/carnithine racemase